MVYLLPKEEMPDVSYKLVKYKNEIAMFGIATNGPVILFTATDELVFTPWDEIIAYAATSPREKLPGQKPEKDQDSATPPKPRTTKEPPKET